MSDLAPIHRLHSLPETDEFNTLGIPKHIDETASIMEAWILDHQLQEIRNYTFAIAQGSANIFTGLIAIKLGSKKYRKAEVWYKLLPEFWGKGYATESLKRILEFGFHQLHLHRIEAGCAVDNIGSIRVLEKVGMLREGRKRKVLPLASGWSDNFEYAILETDS